MRSTGSSGGWSVRVLPAAVQSVHSSEEGASFAFADSGTCGSPLRELALGTRNIMSPCPEDLGMTRLSFLASLGLGGAIIASGGVTLIVGTFLRWKWLVDPQAWWAAFLKRLYGSNAFIRLNYIYGTSCMLMGAALLWSLWPLLMGRCR